MKKIINIINNNKILAVILTVMAVFGLFYSLSSQEVKADDPYSSARGTLSCRVVNQNTIDVSYSVTNAQHAYLFRGSNPIVNIGSGTKSNTVRVSNLSPSTTYIFYLRDGSSYLSPLLSSTSCRTSSAPTPPPTPTASGSVSCQTIDQNNIRVSYSVNNATNAHLFRGTSAIVAIGSGTKSNTVNVSGLSANTSYTFYLRNGSSSSSTLLSSASCRTLTEYVEPPLPPCPDCPPIPPVWPCPVYPCPTPIYGACGTRVGTYHQDETSWPAGTFCSSGTASPLSPVFPSKGSTTSWYCLGQDGGSHAFCSANRRDDDPVITNPSGEIQCYSQSENSITLLYSYSNGSNVSLFRKKGTGTESKIDTWYESFRSNRLFVDSGLSSDSKYTYYLRNGSSSSSTLLAHAVCYTAKKEEGNITVTKTVRNNTKNSAWGNSVTAAPGDDLSFLIVVKANNNDVKNVIVRDILPEKVSYIRNLRVNGILVTSDITSGISIGTVLLGTPQNITFDIQLLGNDYFGAGWTNLVNTVHIFSGGTYQDQDTAEVYVSKGVVAGAATRIATGITNNKLIDFVLLPLLLTFIIWILFRKYFITLSYWMERKKMAVIDFRAKRNLEKVTSRIKIQEKVF